MLAWAGVEASKEVIIKHRRYSHLYQRRRALRRVMDNLYITDTCSRSSLADSFAVELNNLIRQPYFA